MFQARLTDHSNIEEETPIGTPVGPPKSQPVDIADVLDKLSGLMEESLLDDDLTHYKPSKLSYKCQSSQFCSQNLLLQQGQNELLKDQLLNYQK